jgi:MFS superfamily sulfate permease-like transporter
MSRVSLFRGVRPIRRQEVLNDVLAGITLAALGIPEVMGYTKIAETPVVTGLYTLLLPVVAFRGAGRFTYQRIRRWQRSSRRRS